MRTNSYQQQVQQIQSYPKPIVYKYIKISSLTLFVLVCILILFGVLSQNKMIPNYSIAIPATLIGLGLITFLVIVLLMRKAMSKLHWHITNVILFINLQQFKHHLKIVNLFHWQIKKLDYDQLIKTIEEQRKVNLKQKELDQNEISNN
ncbi:hypothetical protein JM47_00275 [Ureaplasma diversum]|uniref:Uncharacterized protein n=1 Tax=Ureaplasma diversum TaxID=42094 RepID=A0A0C5RNQ3_9BACT|nr:hypothetical protein [Ureaplasma diversum]AJQ45104.1 hypothetical protein JM47_00275 [Ureaplasma diversum]